MKECETSRGFSEEGSENGAPLDKNKESSLATANHKDAKLG